MGTKRRKIQMELAFMAEGRGEAPMAVNKGTEVPMVKLEPEDPALTVLLMEQICQRENLRKALRRVRQNKGGPGIDGMTVNKLPGYLKSLTVGYAVACDVYTGDVGNAARRGLRS
jgi:RNA-directed DNA polymerase